ncbi:MAG: phage holin family protein [Burkholderiales bacterium]
MQDDPQPNAARAGLFDSVKGLLGTLVSITHTRIELVSTEVREEADRIRTLLMRSLAALFFLGLGVVLATVAVIIAFWDSYRVPVAVLLAAGSLVVGGILWLRLSAAIRERPRLLDATLGELARDAEALRNRS